MVFMQAPVTTPPQVHSISLENWLTILAILLSPLVALLIQKWLEDRRARQGRKIHIFRELMANRASRLAPAYVQALNGIEVEFYGEKPVIDAWRLLNEHLYSNAAPEDTSMTHWNNTQTDLLNDLLAKMGKALGYDFATATLKRSTYYPTGWGTIENEQHELRKAAIAVFTGKKPLKVEVTEPSTPAPVPPSH
jgi:hypothetical protein